LNDGLNWFFSSNFRMWIFDTQQSWTRPSNTTFGCPHDRPTEL